jgi:hypothetical protein
LLLHELLAMGFSEPRAARGLHFSGNSTIEVGGWAYCVCVGGGDALRLMCDITHQTHSVLLAAVCRVCCSAMLCCTQQGAINWLSEHEADDNLDTPLLVPKVCVRAGASSLALCCVLCAVSPAVYTNQRNTHASPQNPPRPPHTNSRP